MRRKLNILFLGGAKRVSLAEHFLSYGNERNLDVSIFSYELQSCVPIASVGKVIVGLRWRDAELMNHLKQTLKENGIHIVLPFVDPAVEVASALSQECPDVFIPCSERNLCQLMFDKIKASMWFEEHGIDQPKTFFGEIGKSDFPLIFKPKNGSASSGILVAEDSDTFARIQNKESYLIQEYIRDRTEFSVDCYVSRSGEILSIVPRVRLETAGGEVINTRTVRDKALIEASEKILLSGNFRGPITIQFIQNNQNGCTYIMEINPRLGGGVVASIGAGSGIIDLIMRECMGETPEPILDWKDNVLTTRYLKEVVFYADNH